MMLLRNIIGVITGTIFSIVLMLTGYVNFGIILSVITLLVVAMILYNTGDFE